MNDTVIIGAGVTGLSFACCLKKPHVIIEKENIPGGLCRSVNINGCTFDYSGHFLHFHHDETLKFVNGLLGGKLAKIKRNACIRAHGAYVPYPFQANLYALPEKIRKECLEGFLKKSPVSRLPSSSFYDWSISTFGKGITKHFMKPYNEKLWTVSSKVLTAEWVAPFVPQPSIEEVAEGAVSGLNRNFGYNVFFYYPEKGGIQTLVDSLSSRAGKIITGTCAAKIDIKNRIVETDRKQIFRYDRLVSTQPLPELLDQIIGLPPEISAARKKLRWNSVNCLNLAFKDEDKDIEISEKHWIYYPGKKYVFYRSGIYSNILESMTPPGLFSMYIEISSPPGKRVDRRKTLAEVLAGLVKAGLINEGAKPEIVEWMPIPFAYVIYDKEYSRYTDMIHGFLKQNGIYSIGRYGAWKYSFMEESIWEGMKLAEEFNNMS
ncbi:MAG: FAD-dependent oxidoreductase [Elusimicrobiota bacterium]